MAPKRKTPAGAPYADRTGDKSNARSANAEASSHKKLKSNGTAPASSAGHGTYEHYDIVDRRFYPAEMSNARCAMYNDNEIPRPIEQLEQAIAGTKDARAKIETGGAVLHWFKRDLRLFDNRGLGMAADTAKKAGVPLICLFVVSGQDYEAHLTSPARVDFELRTLEVMKKDLAELDIPLLVVSKEKRKEVPGYIVDFCEKWNIKNVFCNIEYEVDELRREVQLIEKCLTKGIAFNPVHDDVIVAPGLLCTGQGKQYAVYTPWFRTWIKYVHNNPGLLKASEKPGKNPSTAKKMFKDLFNSAIPEAPENKTLTEEEKKRFGQLWPAGEHEALKRLDKFISQRVSKYADNRNFPAGNHTSIISVHHSAGTLAARTSVRTAREANSSTALNSGNAGIVNWISEVAWRDFYKHVLAHWPYVCMSKPFKYEYTNIEWEYNDDHFDAWCRGMTGFPIGKHSILICVLRRCPALTRHSRCCYETTESHGLYAQPLSNDCGLFPCQRLIVGLATGGEVLYVRHLLLFVYVLWC
jgi:deoxyribodipyrimidine photo-lyase